MNADVYHPVHFKETADLLHNAQKILDLAEGLRLRCPEQALPSYHELVYYPAAASANLCKMWLYATWNHYFAKQGRIEANDTADSVAECIAADRRLTEEYHRIDYAKWYGMGLSKHIGFTHWCDEDCKYPVMTKIEPANRPRLIVAASDSTKDTIGMFWSGQQIKVTDFLQQNVDTVQIELACGSRGPIAYQVTTDCPWLELSEKGGTVSTKNILTLWLNRKLLNGRDTGIVWVKTTFSTAEIMVEAQNADTSNRKPMTFLEADGYISMEAEHYFVKRDGNGVGFQKLSPYGRTLSAMKVLPPLKSDFTRSEERPYLEYCLIAEQTGIYQIDFYLAPSLPAYIGSKTLFGLQMNGGAVRVESASEYRFLSREWSQSVLDNIHIFHSTVTCRKGENHLRIYAVSACFVLEKIVLYPDGTKLPQSYLGPKESFYVKPSL